MTYNLWDEAERLFDAWRTDDDLIWEQLGPQQHRWLLVAAAAQYPAGV